jgi:hypothetical protein
VEPAIFGTLLERALDPRERHKLGAHYTPRAYVERLVNPTVIEPLREEWKACKWPPCNWPEDGNDEEGREGGGGLPAQAGHRPHAGPRLRQRQLPVRDAGTAETPGRRSAEHAARPGATSKMELEGVMVTPANFFGIELNPRAAAIAEQVLWIGFLQWHLRTHGNLHNLPEPIIKDLHNIENRDAVLDWDSKPLLDADGQPVTRWDGRTTKPHPITGEEVPDPDARVPLYKVPQPAPAHVAQGGLHRGEPAVHWYRGKDARSFG